MLTRWGDFDRMFPPLNEFRRRLDELWDEYEQDENVSGFNAWPRATFTDAGAHLLLKAEVPGLGEKDVKVTLQDDVITIAGERRAAAPEGYQAHRQERGTYKFTRSFSLPVGVDVEKANAMVKHGVLQVVLPKAPEAQPRQIQVRMQ